MSLLCICGCGKELPDSEYKINQWGELETMREECRKLGRGEGLSVGESLTNMYNEILLVMYRNGQIDSFPDGVDDRVLHSVED